MTPITVERDVFASKYGLKGTANVVDAALHLSIWWPRTLLPYPHCHTTKESIIPFERIDGVTLDGKRVAFLWTQDDGKIQQVRLTADTSEHAALLVATLPTGNSAAAEQALAEHRVFSSHLAATTQFTWATPLIVAINVLVFVIVGISGVSWFQPKPDELIPWGANWWPLTTAGEWWRLLSSAFLHYGFVHIALNMWALWAVGRFTERLYGPSVFALIYLASALFSGVISLWWESHNTAIAGASGAVFAVYGALIAYLLTQRASFPTGAIDSLKRSSFAFMFYNLVFGMVTPGICNSAHLSGLVAGFALGLIMARPLNPEHRMKHTWPQVIAGVLAATFAILGGVNMIPKNNANMAMQNQFLATCKAIEPEELRVDAHIRSLFAGVKANQLNDAEMAQRLDTEVIPVFEGFIQRLAANPPGPGPLHHFSQKLTQYFELRAKAYQKLSQACRTNDAKMTAEYNQLITQGDELLKQISQETKNRPK